MHIKEGERCIYITEASLCLVDNTHFVSWTMNVEKKPILHLVKTVTVATSQYIHTELMWMMLLSCYWPVADMQLAVEQHFKEKQIHKHKQYTKAACKTYCAAGKDSLIPFPLYPVSACVCGTSLGETAAHQSRGERLIRCSIRADRPLIADSRPNDHTCQVLSKAKAPCWNRTQTKAHVSLAH